MKHAMRILGVSMLAVLGLMAVSAAGAQATTQGPEFYVELELLENKTEFLGTAEKGELLTAQLAIHCDGGAGSGSIENSEVGEELVGHGTAKVLFEGCYVLGAKNTCHIYNGPEEEGPGHITASGNGKLLEHGGKHYLLVEGLGELQKFAGFYIEGALCPVASEEEFVIEGSTVARLPDGLEHIALHTIETLSLEELKLFPNDELKLGEEPAHLANDTGGPVTASVHLTGKPEWNVGLPAELP